MLSDDRLPKSVFGIFGVAATLYAKRAPLYLSLAALALLVQYVVGVLLPHTDGLVIGLAIIVDAFMVAAVSIGVAFDLADKEADWSTVLLAATERWGVVSIVGLTYYLAVLALQPNVFSSDPADTAYGFLILPIVVFWGAVSMGQVVASIEPVKTQLSLPFLALGKGMAVSLRWANVGRLLILSVLLVLPLIAASALYAALTHHHLHDPEFWANVPIDAAVTGPLQALSTVFYVDFLRRSRA